LAQEGVILAQKDASESKALVTAYKEQWDAEVNELTSRIEPLTRDQAQHQVTKLKLSQAEARAEKLQGLVTEYQAKLEASSAIAQLHRYLDEVGGIPLDEKGKPKARYDQLAKFKQWLGY
jgi:chromosome segregation ATPase